VSWLGLSYGREFGDIEIVQLFHGWAPRRRKSFYYYIPASYLCAGNGFPSLKWQSLNLKSHKRISNEIGFDCERKLEGRKENRMEAENQDQSESFRQSPAHSLIQSIKRETSETSEGKVFVTIKAFRGKLNYWRRKSNYWKTIREFGLHNEIAFCK